MFFSLETTVAILAFYSIIFITGVVGNLCILLTILQSPRFRKSLSNILIADLAFADFCLCLVTAPYYISSLMYESPPKPGAPALDSTCKGFVVSAYALGFTRILLLATISIERFIAIIHPFWYQKYSFSAPGGFQLACICLYAWFHSYICTFPAALIPNWIKYEGKPGRLCAYAWESASVGFVLPVFTLNFLIPLCVIVYTNCKVYITARSQGRRIAALCRVTSPTEVMPATHVPVKSRLEQQNISAPLSVLAQRQTDLFLVKGTVQANLQASTVGTKSRKTSRSGHSDADSAYSENEELRFENPTSPKIPFLLSNSKQYSRNTGYGFERKASKATARKVSIQRSNGAAEEFVDSNSDISSLTTFQRTTKTSICSKLDDSGFKELQKLSCYSEVDSLRREQETDQTKLTGNRKSPKIRQLRLPFLQPTHAKQRNSKFHGRTKDYVIFFSTLCVVSLFLFTWLPFAITTLSVLVTGTILPEKADIFISMMTVIDSAFTPVIVFGTRREFRKMLFKKLFKRSRGPNHMPEPVQKTC